MSAEGLPIVFDTVVLSNFAASESIDWLCSRFCTPRTVAAVERELRRGQAEGYTFVEHAIDRLGEEIILSKPTKRRSSGSPSASIRVKPKPSLPRFTSMGSSLRTTWQPASWRANEIFRSPALSASSLMVSTGTNST